MAKRASKKPSVGNNGMISSDLDAILENALDDFNEQEINRKIEAHDKLLNDKEKEAVLFGGKKYSSLDIDDHIDALGDTNYYKGSLQSTLYSLSNTQEGNAVVDDLFATLANDGKKSPTRIAYPADGNDEKNIQFSDREVASTMRLIAKAQVDGGMRGVEAGKIEEIGENIMEEMIQQFEALNEKEDYQEVIDNVMRQLLSKEIMFDPIKQICEQYPTYLAVQRKNLTSQEYNNYGKQYQVFQKLLAVFLTEPDNFPRLIELMYDLQQYGQPPAEIIKDLAPNLQFDENGLPILNNMGAGFFPGEQPVQNNSAHNVSSGNANGSVSSSNIPLPNLAELSEQMATGQCTIC